MTNLLPTSARERVVTDYRFRLGAVAALLLTAILSVAAALLLPAYFFAWVARNDAITQGALADQSIKQQDTTTSAQDEHSAATLFKATQGQLLYPRPSKTIAMLLALRAPGISVRLIQYDAQGGTPTVHLSGIADTRGHLLAFKQSLAAAAGISNVDLPVESLITATSAPFAITVSYQASSSVPATP